MIMTTITAEDTILYNQMGYEQKKKKKKWIKQDEETRGR